MRNISVFASVIALTVACRMSVATDAILITPGAITQENQDLNAFLNSPDGIEALLRKSPDNRAALLIHASSQIHAGDVLGAKTDLEHIHTLTPDFPNLQDWYAQLYRVAGDGPHEIAALEILVKTTDPAAKRLADYRTARILELRGDVDASRKAWKAAGDNASGSLKTLFQIQAANFETCHGNVKEAIAQLEAVLRQDNIEPEGMVDAQANLSFAYWAAGQEAEAIKRLQLTRVAIGKVPNFNPELESFCALAAFTLTAAGPDTQADHVWAADWLKVAASRNPDSPNSASRVVALLQGKPQPELVGHIRTVLKTAPGLEWVQWSALILRVNHVPDTTSLQIDPNSIPGRLASQMTAPK